MPISTVRTILKKKFWSSLKATGILTGTVFYGQIQGDYSKRKLKLKRKLAMKKHNCKKKLNKKQAHLKCK